MMGMRFSLCGAMGALVLFSVPTSAEAQSFGTSNELVWKRQGATQRAPSRLGRFVVEDTPRAHSGVGPRPRRWCGWWLRTQKGGGPEYNVAWNWRKRGSPSGPQVGAVVVWPHHVGIITGRAANGQWIVRSGNDGGRVRERARSVAGAVFRTGV